MTSERPPTILCLASYFKGASFLTAARDEGARVLLLTREKLRDEAWPRASIDELYFMPVLSKQPDILYAVSYLARTEHMDRIIPLDDYDVETAAHLREHMRLPGLDLTRTRYFRDKLAMRLRAQRSGIPVPQFCPVFHHETIADFLASQPPPWVLKPRSEAGAMGIKKAHTAEELWSRLEALGDEQSHFLIEEYLAGDVYHVDSIVWQGEIVFAQAHRYAAPPMTVSHEGGVFVSQSLAPDAAETRELLALNEQLLPAFGLKSGVSHTEFIRDAQGTLYFLETAARVGGANIEQLVEGATGVNLWAEWARLELALARGETYAAPAARPGFAGLLVCLARQERPDLSGYTDPEITFRLQKKHHAGLVVAASDPGRVDALIAEYRSRFAEDFLAVAPPLDKPPA